ncbi:DUF2637 domain-containing protein [Allostreptomyces psammosilenae]|uniref:Uncharacterized protein (DUF4415 family) n=1 Tax=Allostreptomyces psammosilenae TaxID=1892865 RepID=A0A852ZWE3_9ACTN|nr:DUF2637 domain-containing protein [Allostreptomyces psammosilenae]NYI05570.1 uncharacterized protein (DUF4415 family) [Allostreptomyces psammosilenae]
MSSDVTTYEGRVAVDKARAVEARAAAREAERLSELRIRQAEAAARDAERERAEAAREKARERWARERAERRAARAARLRLLAGVLAERRVLLAVLVVIAASVYIAWPAQQHAMAALGMGTAGSWAVPVLVEGLTWSMAALTSWAIAERKPAGLYQLMTWVFASVAAGLNLWHGWLDDPMLGVVYAIASLGGVGAWELYVHGRKHAGTRTTREEARFRRQRRRHHRKVARAADRIRTGAGMHLTEDAAWLLAWRATHGADPGVTAELLAQQERALGAVAELVAGRTAESGPEPVTVEALAKHGAELSVVAPAEAAESSAEAIRAVVEQAVRTARPVRELLARTGPDAAGEPVRQAVHAASTDRVKEQVSVRIPPPRTGTGRTVHPAARTAAKHTARRSARQGDDLERKRQAAREEAAAILARGGKPSPAEIGRAHGMSPEWGAKQISYVVRVKRPMHLVKGAGASAGGDS